MKLFEFDIHIGDWRVLVQSRDIQNGAVQSRHITNNAVITDKIGDGEVKSVNIAPEAVITSKIGDREVKSRNIGKGAVTNDKIGENEVKGDHIEPDGVHHGNVADDAIWTRNIKDRNVTGPKIALQCVLPEHFHQGTFWTLVRQYVEELQNQIDSLQVSGLALSNIFGGDPHIGISQKKLSWFANYVLTLLEEALGRTLLGFTWTVTPTYIYGEWPTTVHISAQPVTEGDFFEHIRLYQGDQLIDEVIDPTDSYSFDISLQQTVNLRIEAQLLGVVYQRTQKVNHYDSFWLGGGAAYTDIMDEAHNINFSEGTRIARDVTVADGEHIIIMMGDAWVPAFIRADMNGVEIAFDESTVTIDGKDYKVLTSKSVFEAGTYNIDING